MFSNSGEIGKLLYCEDSALLYVTLKFMVYRFLFLDNFSTQVHSEARDAHSFGLFFDIDGVITRGKVLLPHTKAAFRLLTDECKNFKIPTIFVTNAGNSMRQSKADHLSELLDIRVSEI